MNLFRLDVLVSGIFLESPFRFIIRGPFKGETKEAEYKVQPVTSFSPDFKKYISNDIKDKLPEFKETGKLSQELEKFENLYKEANPLVLITIDGIPSDFVLDDATIDIPNFFYEKVEEFILALSFIFFSPVRPIFYLLTSLDTGKKRLNINAGGITVDKYKKNFSEIDLYEIVGKYFWEVVKQQRILSNQSEELNERAKRFVFALEFYRSALSTAPVGRYPLGIGIRFVHYWSALEVLSGGFRGRRNSQRVRRILNHYFPGENLPVEKWSKMRNCIVHLGKFLEDCNYSEECGNLRKLIHSLVLKIVAENNTASENRKLVE